MTTSEERHPAPDEEPAASDDPPDTSTGSGIERPRGPASWLTEVLAGRRPSKPLSLSPSSNAVDDPKQIVNGIDERERRYSLIASVVGIGFVITGYIANSRSTVTSTRSVAGTLLIAGLVLCLVLVAGTIFRRRALIGFASFMLGFELIAASNVFGLLFLLFGGWLLVRALHRQRDRRLADRPTTKAKASAPKALAAPKASKRYTPPARSRTSSRRR